MKELQNITEMAEALTAHKQRDGYTGKIYKAASDQHKGEELEASLEANIEALKASRRRGAVDWNDLEAIENRTYDYLTACARSQTYPSVMGLAVHGLGVSRQALNDFLTRYPDSPSAKFINMAKDCFADILTNASLFRNADPVSTIFQLKNHFSHTDRVQLEPVKLESPLGHTLSAEEIAEKYKDLPED